MAFENKKSWRLKFIDVDSSFQIKSGEDPVIGYFAVRAPKGTQRPMYFAKDNGDAIDALIGLGTADWPDIVEAKAFNVEYPCYISAPCGTSKVYPSYLGGFYLTKKGIYKFYNVESKDDLLTGSGNAFKAKVQPGIETAFDPSFAGKLTQIEIGGPTIPDYIPEADQIGYGFFSMKTDDNYYIKFTKNSQLEVTSIDYDTMKKGLVDALGTDTTYWGDDESIWDFTTNTATLPNFGLKYTEAQLQADDFNAFSDWIGPKNYKAVTDDAEAIATLLLTGYAKVEDAEAEIAFGIQNTFTFAVDIKDSVYAYFMQKGCTEVPTTVEISDIGYDEYFYEKLLNYAPYNKATFDEEGVYVPFIEGTLSEAETAELKAKLSNNKYVVFYDPDYAEDGPTIIGVLDDTDPDNIFYTPYDGFATKQIALQDAIIGGKKDNMFHKFYKVAPDGKTLIRARTEEEIIEEYGEIDGPQIYTEGIVVGTSAIKAPNFNQISFSCKEKVYAGSQWTSGGEFEGSLDEAGENLYGAPNYLEELIQDNDVSFLEVRVVKKFGDDSGDLDGNGFWQHSRVIDPYDIDKNGSSPTVKKFTVEGDRYATLVMQQNKAIGKQGGAWNVGYEQLIHDSLAEACLGEYDDAYIFVECTGQECFKADLLKINKAQQLAAVISPKILSPNKKGIITKEMANKVIVKSRCSTSENVFGVNALFAGEFEVYDEITKKRYYRMPIGSVAKMMARNFDKAYGGKAIAWMNENGIGGQLTDVKAIRSRYQLDDDANEHLDSIGINPIVLASDTGVMISSQKTTQDPNFFSDWSFLSAACSFILVKREIRDKVMRPQVMKPINSHYMSLRQSQTDGILSRRLGENGVWDSATCDVAGVNNAYTKSQKNFVIKVEVTPTPTSETVTLMLDTKSLQLTDENS